jgi:acyl carrier protein phosphodiesterase
VDDRRSGVCSLAAIGDRSHGRKQVLALVRTTPERVSELAELTDDGDWLVSMRALDLLEKIAHEHAD